MLEPLAITSSYSHRTVQREAVEVRTQKSNASDANANAFVYLAGVLVVLMVQAASLVRDLCAFVMTHSADLSARDQIVVHQSKLPGSSDQ
jgi:hypothetical protein